MDRLMVRSPATWRSVDSTFIRSFTNKSFTDNRSTPKLDSKLRRLSIRDETLIKLFSSQPDQPLNDENVNPVELFRSISQPAKLPDGAAFKTGPVGAAATCVPVGSCQAVADRTAHEPADAQDLEVMAMTPPTDVAPSSAENVFNRDRALRHRLQRDLNSPSANARMRAMKALKSPTKTAYANFDVPYEEQDIITDEERQRPKSIQEVMRDVVVYVEVRTGEDNRSAGVKKVISQLGAKVNDKFLRDTTHVVFKDGLQSTYNKAKKWEIPIVSILWIEACKKHMVLVNPKLYPISNYERYENPDLHAKIKRQKSMQPNAEESARRHKCKSSTPAGSKETDQERQAVNNHSTRIAIPRKPKDKLGEILSEFKEKLLNTPDDSEDIIKADSKILERIQNSPYTAAINKLKSRTKSDSLRKYAILDSYAEDYNSDDDFEERKPVKKTPEVNARKTLAFDPNDTSSGVKKQTKVNTPSKRRATIVPPPANTSQKRSTCASSTNRFSVGAKTLASQKSVQSARISRRVSISTVDSIPRKSKSAETTTPCNKTAILEESCDIDETGKGESGEGLSVDLGKEIVQQNTTFGDVQLDITKASFDNNNEVRNADKALRRTLYTPQGMDQTPAASQTRQLNSERAASVNRRRTCFNFETPKHNVAQEAQATPSKRPNDEETLLISDNCPPSIRKSVRRRTMFPQSEAEENTTATQQAVTLRVTSVHDPKTVLAGTATPVAKVGTILDEVNNSLVFNSTRAPTNNRRRTMFDISMDIIDQRLQNINKSAKQSRLTVFEPREPDNANIDETRSAQSNIVVASAKAPIVSSDQLDKDKDSRPTSIDSFTSHLKGDSFKSSTQIGPGNVTPMQPKKRKLFVPTELLFSTPPNLGSEQESDKLEGNDGSLKKKAKTDTKSTKTMKRTNGAARKLLGSSVVKGGQGRRSTLDFEQIDKCKTAKIAQAARQQSVEAKTNVIVCTNMHTEQMNFIKQAIEKFGGFQLENTVSDNTTHVVSLEPRRTFNLLRGIVRGLWIVSYAWIVDSMAAGKWLFEEPYEMIHFSRAVEICRSQRQAFGSHFKIDLFADIAPIYVSPTSNVPAKPLEELILLCAGYTVQNVDEAKYVLGDTVQNKPDQICLNPLWILDSIQDCRVKKIHKYIMKSAELR